MRVRIDPDDLDERDLERWATRLVPFLAGRLPVAEAPTTRMLTSASVARMLDLTRKAFEMRLVRARARGEVHALEKMAITVDGCRRWHERDVLAWIEASR